MNTTTQKRDEVKETVTDITTDSWGVKWGKIGSLRVYLSYAIDANGTWVDVEDGNYHFHAI